MANWCVNYIRFTGNKKDIKSFEREIDFFIKNYHQDKVQTLGGYCYDPSIHDFIFDLKKYEVSDTKLSIRYKTIGEVSITVLQFICARYNLEFKGRSLKEDNSVDTSEFVIGLRNINGEFQVFKKSLADCGLEVNNFSDAAPCFTQQFLEQATMDFADTLSKNCKLAVKNIQPIKQV